jgi:hypothetical protein
MSCIHCVQSNVVTAAAGFAETSVYFYQPTSRRDIKGSGLQNNQLLPAEQKALKPKGRLFTTVLKSTSVFSLSFFHWL